MCVIYERKRYRIEKRPMIFDIKINTKFLITDNKNEWNHDVKMGERKKVFHIFLLYFNVNHHYCFVHVLRVSFSWLLGLLISSMRWAHRTCCRSNSYAMISTNAKQKVVAPPRTIARK